MSTLSIEEHFRAWGAVPTSDLRGQMLMMNSLLVAHFEKGLPPWRRAIKKSNGRLFGRIMPIKIIRGIHIRTDSLRRGK
jgi:hypothetical protein